MKAIIFDLDGTILDSLFIWEELAIKYLESIGIKAEKTFMNEIENMNLEESTKYMKEKYSINKEEKEILSDIKLLLKGYYENNFESKKGVIDYIEKLYNSDYILVVGTTLDSDLAEIVLERLGIRQYFYQVFCEDSINISKRQSGFYSTIANGLKINPKYIAVFEDSLYAIKSAKAAGIYTIGVLDKYTEKYHSEIKKLADKTIENFEDMEDIL